jgi:hypothetical protein
VIDLLVASKKLLKENGIEYQPKTFCAVETLIYICKQFKIIFLYGFSILYQYQESKAGYLEEAGCPERI